jgi:tetratricopeptide (TPR) repeat protein
VALIQAELCADAALAGNWAEAVTYARQALAYRKYDILPLVISPRWLETEALLRNGDVELARADSQHWGELVGHLPRFRLPHLHSLAVLAQGEGNGEQAIVYLQEANILAEKIGLLDEQWQILATLAKLYQLRDEEQRAREAFERAIEIVQVLAAKIDDESLRAVFLSRATGLCHQVIADRLSD